MIIAIEIIFSRILLGPIGVVLLQFSIPKPKPHLDLEFLCDHPEIVNQQCVDAMRKAVEDLKQKNQIIPGFIFLSDGRVFLHLTSFSSTAFLFYWKAHMLATCVEKGPETFFSGLSAEGGLTRYLSQVIK